MSIIVYAPDSYFASVWTDVFQLDSQLYNTGTEEVHISFTR